MHTRARAKFRGDVTRGERQTLASRLLEISRARVYCARPTIAIAKIRDYSQSKRALDIFKNFYNAHVKTDRESDTAHLPLNKSKLVSLLDFIAL